MSSNYKQTQYKIISDFQIERDQVIFELLKIKERLEQQQKLILLNEYVDFNAAIVLPYLMPLFINNQAIDFLLKNHKEIKRKMTFIELVEYGNMFRLSLMFSAKINTLADLKYKYKKIKPTYKIK